MLDPAFSLSSEYHPISIPAAATTSTFINATADNSVATTLPSFSEFQFKVIGKQPELLNRFSAPDPSIAYHSPTPPVSPAVSPIITRPPLSRPSLLQALTSEDSTFVSSESQSGKGQMPLPAPTNQSSFRTPNTRTSNDLIPPIESLASESSHLGTQHAAVRSRAPFLKPGPPPQGQRSYPASSSTPSENKLSSRPPSTQSAITTSTLGSSRLSQQGQNTVCQKSTAAFDGLTASSTNALSQAHSPLVDQAVHTRIGSDCNPSSPHLVGGTDLSRASIQSQATSILSSSNSSLPANTVVEDLQLARDFDALQARLQEASAVLAMLAPQPSAPPFFDMFPLSASDYGRGGQLSSNSVMPTTSRSMHEAQVNTEDNSKALITQNLTLVHTLQTNADVLLQTAQTLCSGLRTAEVQTQAVLALVEKERLRNEESRSAEEEAQRGRDEDVRRFSAWRDEVREWYRTAEDWRRIMEEKVDKAVIESQDVRAALDRMKEQQKTREERMRQEEAIAEDERQRAAQRTAANIEQAAREEAEKSLREQHESQARARELESQRESEKQKQFKKQHAEVMAMKQEASLRNAARIRAYREKENARLLARVGDVTEAQSVTVTRTMRSAERPSAPPTSSSDSNSSDSRQPSAAGSVVPSSLIQVKARVKERNTPLSGGIEVSELKEGGDTIRAEVGVDVRLTSVTPRAQPSSSGTSGGRNASNVSVANLGPSFVPAATEAGRQVVTEMPFSSITLASEKNPKTTRELVTLSPPIDDHHSIASQNHVAASSSTSPRMSTFREATDYSEHGANSVAHISRVEQSANLRHLRAVVPRLDESGSGDRSVKTRASVENIRKKSSSELIVKKEDDGDSKPFGEGFVNANDLAYENAASATAPNVDDMSVNRAEKIEPYVEASGSVTEVNAVIPPRSRPKLLIYGNSADLSRAQAEKDIITKGDLTFMQMSDQSSPGDHAQSLDNGVVHVSDQAQSNPVINTSIRPHHIQPIPAVIPHTGDKQPNTSVSVMHLGGASNQPSGSSEEFADNCATQRGAERTPETPVSVGGSDMYSAGVAYSNSNEVQDHDRDQTSHIQGSGENEQRYNTQDGWASQRRSSRHPPNDHSPPPPATFYEFNSCNDRYPQRSPALHSPPSEHHPSPMAGRKRARDSDEWFGTETSYRPRRLRPDESDRNIGRGWRVERPPSPRWHPPAATRRRSPTPEWQRRHDDQQRFRRSSSPGRQRVIYRRQVSPISPHRAGAFPPHPRITRAEGASRVPPKASGYRPSYQDDEDMSSSETRDPRVRLQDKGDWTSETQTYTFHYRQDTEDIVHTLPRNDDDLGGDHASLLSRMSDTQKPLQTFTYQRGIPNRGRGRGRLPLMSRLSSGIAPLQDRLSG